MGRRRLDRARARAVRAVQHFFAGQPAPAARWFDAAITGRRHGELIGFFAQMTSSASSVATRSVRGTTALLDANVAIELADDLGQRWVLAVTRHRRVGTCRPGSRRGRRRTPEAGLVRGADLGGDVVVRGGRHGRDRTSVAADAAGDSAQVAATLAPMFADGGGGCRWPTAWSTRPTYIAALIDTSRLDDARDAHDAFRRAATARRLDVEMHHAAIHGQLAVAQGDANEARSRFDEAAAAERADVRVLDRVMMNQRRRAPAAQPRTAPAAGSVAIAHARELLVAAGATPYLERLDAEFPTPDRVTGARQRRSRFDLTDRERDVGARQPRPDQPGGRRGAVRQREGRRVPPRQHLRQAAASAVAASSAGAPSPCDVGTIDIGGPEPTSSAPAQLDVTQPRHDEIISLAYTLRRWNSTALELMYSSPATSLFVIPFLTNVATSSSRVVSAKG